GSGAVDAIDLKAWGIDTASRTPGQTSLSPERYADQLRAELESNGLDRQPWVFVAGECGGKLLRRDDRTDVVEQVGDAGAHLLDVHQRRNACFTRVTRGLGGRGGLMTINEQHPSGCHGSPRELFCAKGQIRVAIPEDRPLTVPCVHQHHGKLIRRPQHGSCGRNVDPFLYEAVARQGAEIVTTKTPEVSGSQ